MIQDFLSLFFPNYCFTCHETLVRGEVYLCTACQYSLPKTNYHLSDQNPLFQRFGGLMPLSNIFAYLKFSKKGMVQKIMEKLKYQNCPEIGMILGQWYGAELKPFVSGEIDMVLPVPLHATKIRKRGYNQSDFFAKGLSQALEVEWDSNVLKRKVKSETQTKKGRKERFDNVMGIFEVARPEAIRDKRILLVDDVITTGATLYACSSSLISAGAKGVSLCALAVAQ